ncbi:MAG: hypothetical protein R6U84_07345 [Candidatus Cloacimonadales bacterium]
MKKFFKFIWITLVGWLVLKLVKKVLALAQYSQFRIFGNLCYRTAEEQELQDSYAMIFSALELNLLEHEPKEKVIHLKLYGRFASLEVKLPANWNLQLQGEAKYSDISNPVEPQQNPSDQPLLIIEHDLKFTALVIATDAENLTENAAAETELPE